MSERPASVGRTAVVAVVVALEQLHAAQIPSKPGAATNLHLDLFARSAVIVVGLLGGKFSIPIPMFPLRPFSIHGTFVASLEEARELLELDDERVCRSDCAGLCPKCGIDLNSGWCECDNEVKDHRWAALDGLVLDD